MSARRRRLRERPVVKQSFQFIGIQVWQILGFVFFSRAALTTVSGYKAFSVVKARDGQHALILASAASGV